MSFVRKTKSQIVVAITALLSLTRRTNAEELRDLLIDAFGNFLGSIYYSEVNAFVTGDNSVKSIATVNMTAGTVITIVVASRAYQYTLKAGTCSADVSHYVIKPTDYNGSTNAKYWVKAGVWYREITNTDVVNGEYSIKHGIGVQYGTPVIYDNGNYLIPLIDINHVAGDETNYGYRALDADNSYWKFVGTITGTYKLLIFY